MALLSNTTASPSTSAGDAVGVDRQVGRQVLLAFERVHRHELVGQG